jgi:hypothetical protein
MSRHASKTQAPPSLAERITELLDEIYDVIESAEDCEWRGVQHKAEEAHGALSSALVAARQYEEGRR